MYGDRGTVVAGEVIDHGHTVLAPRPPRPPRRPRRPRWPWVVSMVWVLALLCGGVPTVWVGVPIVRDTLRAGEGASSPFSALLQWFLTFDNDDSDGERLADRAVVALQRAKVAKARADFLASKRDDLARHPEVTGASITLSGPQPGMPPEAGYADRGTTANVLMYVDVSFYYRDMPPLMGSGSGGLPWRAVAHKQRDGWRLYSIDITPYCGKLGEPMSGYAKC